MFSKTRVPSLCLMVIVVIIIAGCSTSSGSLSISDKSLDFGEEYIGYTVSKDITLINKYDKKIEITSVELSNSNDYSINLTQPFYLEKNEEYKLTIDFIPSTSGLCESTLTITHSGSKKQRIISLTGTGKPFAKIELSTQSFNFGSLYVNTSKTLGFEIMNTGTLELNVSNIQITGSGISAYSIEAGSTPPLNIAIGAKHLVKVKFYPKTKSTFDAQIEISHNAEKDTSPVILNLAGKAVTVAPEIEFSETTVKFGKVNIGESMIRDLDIKNIGSTTMTITSYTITGANSSGFVITSGGNAPTMIAPGTKHTLTFMFMPTAKLDYDSVLEIEHDAINESTPAKVILDADEVMTPPLLKVSRTLIDFGSIKVSSSSVETLEISNVGYANLEINMLQLLYNKYFKIESIVNSNGNPISIPCLIPPAGKIVLKIKFSPSAVTSYNDELTFVHNGVNDASPFSVNIIGKGQ